VLPLFGGIYKRGAGLGAAIAFLYSGPAINVMAIVVTAKVLHHGALADVDGHRTGDDECRQQAEDHVLAGIPLGQAQAFQYRIFEARLAHWKEEDQQERDAHAKQHLRLCRVTPPEVAQMRP
jgi:hypothetical protein